MTLADLDVSSAVAYIIIYISIARSRSSEREFARKEYHISNRNEPRVFKISIDFLPLGTRVSEVSDAFERYISF